MKGRGGGGGVERGFPAALNVLFLGGGEGVGGGLAIDPAGSKRQRREKNSSSSTARRGKSSDCFIVF